MDKREFLNRLCDFHESLSNHDIKQLPIEDLFDILQSFIVGDCGNLLKYMNSLAEDYLEEIYNSKSDDFLFLLELLQGINERKA